MKNNTRRRHLSKDVSIRAEEEISTLENVSTKRERARGPGSHAHPAPGGVHTPAYRDLPHQHKCLVMSSLLLLLSSSLRSASLLSRKQHAHVSLSIKIYTDLSRCSIHDVHLYIHIYIYIYEVCVSMYVLDRL